MVVGVPSTYLRNYLQQYYNVNIQSTPEIERRHKEAKDAIRGLLEILNAKYVAELRKDPNKEAEFMVSNFSDIAVKIVQKRYMLREIVSIVQMAIIKMYIEADKDGDMETKVQDFFNEMGNTSSANQNQSSSNAFVIENRSKQLYIEENEMNEYLRIQTFQAKRIKNITSALLNEHLERPESLEAALQVWNKLRSDQGCERTVAILQKLHRRELVEKYAVQVFEMRPDIGLKLFTEGSRNSSGNDIGFHPNPLIDMDVDAVINFLNNVQKSAKRREDKLELTYEQKYLLKLCDIANCPEKYFTQLGCSLIDALYLTHSRKNKGWDRKDPTAKKVESMKGVLNDFLNNKSNYNPEILKERIGTDTWLTDEYILVLVKGGKPKEAINLYVQLEQFHKAFSFGEAH